MDPLTIGLLLGGAFLFLKGKPAPVAVPVAVAPPTMTSPQAAVIQYAAGTPPPRVVEDTGASPIELTGPIPAYQATAGSSAVALGALAACGCAGSLGRACPSRYDENRLYGTGCPSRYDENRLYGLGDVKSDREALRTKLKALRDSFRTQLRALIVAKNEAGIRALVAQFRAAHKALLDSYHAAHPNDRPEIVHTSPSVAPVFMHKGGRH